SATPIEEAPGVRSASNSYLPTFTKATPEGLAQRLKTLVPVGPPNVMKKIAGHATVTLWAARPRLEVRRRRRSTAASSSAAAPPCASSRQKVFEDETAFATLEWTVTLQAGYRVIA